MHHHDHDDELHDHDKGLSHDLPRMLSRRRALGVFGGAGLLALAGCADDATTGTSTTAAASSPAATATASTAAAAGERDPGGDRRAVPGGRLQRRQRAHRERHRPQRHHARASGRRPASPTGVPLTITLTVLDVANGAASPCQGAAVYLWHCDIDGNYSLYSQGVDATRTTCAASRRPPPTAPSRSRASTRRAYSGRWPHIHFEVYPSLEAATSASGRLRTSQLALPEDDQHARVRHRRVRPERRQPRPDLAGHRQRVLSTATRCSSPRSPGTSPTAWSRR